MLTAMVVAVIAAVAQGVQTSFEYSEAYGTATQHARVALERITRAVDGATANQQFPGVLILPDQDGTWTFPATLVVWHPSGSPANPTGLPLYSELVIYTHDPNSPNELVELTTPGDTGTVPNYTDTATWTTSVAAIKVASSTQKVILTDRLRTAQVSATTPLRGAVRFEARLTPSQAAYTSYQQGATAWNQMIWPQGMWGSLYGLRQVWVQIELQIMPDSDLTVTGAAARPGQAYFGSAAIYYSLSK